MPLGTASQTDVDIDLGSLLGAVWRRKAVIGALTLAAAALAFMVTAILTPLYKSETRILIEAREPVYSTEQNQRPAENVFDERAIASQVEIVKSVDLVKKVAVSLNLAALKEFDPEAEPSAISGLLVTLGLKKDPLDVPEGERVLKAFYKKLDVYAVPSSRIIVIEFNSRDAALAARIPNALAEAYLEFNSGLKLENNSDASAWLEPEIADLRLKVRDAEQKVAAYRAEKGLMLVNERDTLAAKQLSDISTELNRVRAERADAEARAGSVRRALASGQPVDAIADVLNSTLIQRLREAEGGIRAQIADLATTLLDGHPRMKGLRAQLGDVEKQILSETRKVLASLEGNARLAATREEELVSQLNTLKAGSAREGEETVELRSLERDATSQRDLLETYLARYRESASRSVPRSSPADARVISRAVPAVEAYFPKKLPIIGVSAFAMLILSSIYVLLAELFSGRALRPAEGATGYPDLLLDGVVPGPLAETAGRGADMRPEGIMGDPERETESHSKARMDAEPGHRAVPETGRRVPSSDSPLKEAAGEPGRTASAPDEDVADADLSDFSVESVAGQLLADQAAMAVSISPEGDEGSAVAVMLARTVAGEGVRTLLVDLTMSGCPTELMAESKRLPGLTDLLCGEVSIADAIHADRLSDAQIIPRGNATARRAMRAVERLPMIMDAVSEAYDLVIVECGSADAESISRIARTDGAEIILTVVHPDEQRIAEVFEDFRKHGFGELLLMAASHPRPGGPARKRHEVA